MFVTATEFKNNFGKYLELAKTDTIYITRHGRPEFRLSGSVEERKRVLDSIDGILKYDGDTEELLKERLNEI
ncbi:MAG: type II toxin-antitoxin system Phd/YefM family antitoxin [Candidatus Methanoplasma sp.]|jgi:prevent-host-death family protein|nr:type II toxin-antitoxin system Phd/YefM family antitoxin [Candidatus Methanoplasma sp.]